jgi:UDP-2,3-diacylglucosamine pyrophosphatase LpxH
MKIRKYKSIFASDAHVGCHAKELHQFLKDSEYQNLFLIGDIVDCWRFDRKHWDSHHSKLLRYLLKQSSKKNLIYITGNHDHTIFDFLGDFNHLNFVVTKEFSYEVEGRRYLLTHGDRFDAILFSSLGVALAKLGAFGYDSLILINGWVNWFLKFFGMKRFFLSRFVKDKFKKANAFIGNFEAVMAEYARENGYDGVICGHIHSPEHRNIDEIEYINCGDWVESLSAVVEHLDGRLELVKFEDLYGNHNKKGR